MRLTFLSFQCSSVKRQYTVCFIVPVFEEKWFVVICIVNVRRIEIEKSVFSLIIKSAIIYFVPIMY